MTKPKQAPAGPPLSVDSAHTFRQGSLLVAVLTDGYISVSEAPVSLIGDDGNGIEAR